MEEELEGLNRHSDMLHQQNDVLNGELVDALHGESLVDRDRLAIARKDNDDQLRMSLAMLSDAKARSPVRR